MADWLLDQVVVKSGEGHTLLQTDKVTIRAGGITLITGPNGAGKTTLLEAMAGLRLLTEGRIWLGEAPLWLPEKRNRLNREVLLGFGIAMQHSDAQWFHGTVREELSYSAKPYRKAEKDWDMRMEATLLHTGLSLDMLERDPWSLSGGEQKRLSIACLLVCEPEWLLLDEPAAGLDAEGISRLAGLLAAHKAAGGGAVVITHDLDALLPVADTVIAVDGGTVCEAASAADWAAAHPAAAPQALRALAQLRAAGLLPPQPEGASGVPLWPAPRELAAALAGRLAQRPAAALAPPARGARAAAGAEGAYAAPPAAAPRATRGMAALPAAAAHSAEGARAAVRGVARARAPIAERFDPRTLVASLLLFSTALLTGNGWLTTAAGAAAVLAALVPLRAAVKPWLGVIRAYVLLVLIMGLIAGIHFMPLSFDMDRALSSVHQMVKLLLVMMLGMPFMSLMTPFRLQRAIEQTFGRLAWYGFPVTPIALTVTLMFRFIPLLSREWGRFTLIAHARGKHGGKPGSMPLKQIAPAFIPYLRSILRMAEQLADALEARGIGHPNARPTQGFKLAFTRQDGYLFAASAIASIILVLFEQL
ncbi:ATP-binding cassette domain-containing protein [Paenibacillus protaetiae]|uniref:ATP-binding cassette domain-containing protein n=1 Tax=Paenibacillus protaetiae TaxID=2509456 RepID=A0A4P6ETB7_9BACL|nr:ATP-binding cassette domain-containing protein [Paenibacillus protaetiae]QAY65675.1 ATP-binding cassette domain-containing protein [Paenibacillus protaetiae]